MNITNTTIYKSLPNEKWELAIVIITIMVILMCLHYKNINCKPPNFCKRNKKPKYIYRCWSCWNKKDKSILEELLFNCSICQDILVNEDIIYKLNCNHYFHQQSIDLLFV